MLFLGSCGDCRPSSGQEGRYWGSICREAAEGRPTCLPRASVPISLNPCPPEISREMIREPFWLHTGMPTPPAALSHCPLAWNPPQQLQPSGQLPHTISRLSILKSGLPSTPQRPRAEAGAAPLPPRPGLGSGPGVRLSRPPDCSAPPRPPWSPAGPWPGLQSRKWRKRERCREHTLRGLTGEGMREGAKFVRSSVTFEPLGWKGKAFALRRMQNKKPQGRRTWGGARLQRGEQLDGGSEARGGG